LQHEHLVPLDAISQSNALDSHSLAIDLQSHKHNWVRGPQAKHYHGKHIPKVLNLLEDLGTLLFIEEGRKLVVAPFSRALTALSDCPWSILGLSVIQKTSRWCITDNPWGLDGLSEVKGRTVWGQRTDCPSPTDRPSDTWKVKNSSLFKTRTNRGLSIHHSRTVRDHPFSTQPKLGKTTLAFSSDVQIRWSWTLWKSYSEDYPSQLNAWPKTLWIKAELLTKIHHKSKSSTPLQMCQPHKCTTLRVSELAFSQTFFKGIFTLFTTPLDPSNIAMLDRSSGTRWPICKQVCPSW
jgi:hypothetical protein